MSNDIDGIINNCTHYLEHRPSQRREPLLSTPLPQRPWQKIASDLGEHRGKTYLVVVDYYSQYIEITHLTQTRTTEVVGKLKNMFSRWVIPEEIYTDNGPQYSLQEFCNFANTYMSQHRTSSPHYPQTNGEAERAIQTAKQILCQEDPFLGLMTYCNTPIEAT